MIQTRKVPYILNNRLDEVASIGVIALATDAIIEREWRQLLDMPGVSFYLGRIASSPEVNPGTLRAMGPRMTDAMSTLLPDSELDCVVYACTSGSLFIGEEQVCELIRKVRPGIAVTNPLTAVKAALRALGTRRVGMLTPYIDAVNQPLVQTLINTGFEVPVVSSFLNDRDPEVVRINAASIHNACLEMAKLKSIDTLYIACTALAASALVPMLETQTGLAVTTSNHAMAWHALRLCNMTESLGDRGRLFAI
ncbi:MAG: Asp/Glu racemase [marine bacterium B5-7]|nr:MAG: Asp/Glu racemase [marine bacterium B5-7]